MPGNPVCTVFVGNLDEKVDERVLYEIMIQAGPVVDMYIPRDKETNRHKGYGFTEYATEENAQYAIKLFSGLVCLQNKTLRFAISGQDKPSPNQNGASVSPNQTPSTELPPVSAKQTHSHSRQSPAQETSCRPLPYLSPISSHSSVYNSSGAIRNGHNLENTQHSHKYNSSGAIRNGHNLENTKHSQSSKYDSPGAIRNGYNLENSYHSQSYNYSSEVIKAQRLDSHLMPVGRIGSGYAFAYPSY